jgi:hypothetical protein
MAYRNFQFIDLKNKFGVEQTRAKLFDNIIGVAPSERLKSAFDILKDLSLTTEKALSEAIVFPILTEIKIRNRDKIQLFSGESVNSDRQNGLSGECDFIFAKAPGSFELMAPIISITEAKNGEADNPRSLAQTSAQLIGARLFNQQRNTPTEVLFGACTSGYDWIFLKLEGSKVIIDTERYVLNDINQLLGVLQHIIDIQTA